MPEDQDTLSGARLGEYQLGTQLGQLGPLSMYRTLDPATGADLAIGVIAGPAARHADLLDVIRRVVALKHTHIIPIYDVGAEGETRYLVAPLLADALRERLARDGALSPMRAGQLVAQVAWAVVAMREANLPEPPISTGNILLDDEGLAILADTSLARGGSSAIRAFQRNGATGWPINLTPYLGARRQRPATQTELVYSLGTVLYELLTATEKPVNPTTAQMETLMVTAPLVSPANRAPELWHELEEVMLKALADERERFSDIREFAIEIRRIVSQYDDGAPSGKSLAVLKRGRKTSPPAFRLDEWAFVRPPAVAPEASDGQGVTEGHPSEPVDSAWEEVVAAEELVEQADDETVERVTGEEVVFGEELAPPVEETPPAANHSRPEPPVTGNARRGRAASPPLKPNKPVSAAELRARLSGSPAPIPGKRLTGGPPRGPALPAASSAPAPAPVAPEPGPTSHVAGGVEQTDTRIRRQPAARGRVASKPLLPPSPGARSALGNTNDPDATVRLPVRQAPTSELLAQAAARTPPRPLPDVRVRSTDPPEISPVAVRPVLSESTPSMYLGDPTNRRRHRGERRSYPLVVLAALALILALGGAGAIALGASDPNHSNDNTIVVSATQTAQARASAQPTHTPSGGPTGPARPNVTPTPTSAPVGVVVIDTPTPPPSAPTNTPTPSGPLLTISPQHAIAANNAGTCSKTFTVTPSRAGLSWQWMNDPATPALLSNLQYTINGGAPFPGLPADGNTSSSPDTVAVTFPCNPSPVVYKVDLASGGAGTTVYMVFDLQG